MNRMQFSNIVERQEGLHSRPAHYITDYTSELPEGISIEVWNTVNNARADGRSILNMMTLVAEKGHEIKTTVLSENGELTETIQKEIRERFRIAASTEELPAIAPASS